MSDHDEVVLQALDALTAGPLPVVDLDAVVSHAKTRRTRRALGTSAGLALTAAVMVLGAVGIVSASNHGGDSSIRESAPAAVGPIPAPPVPRWTKGQLVPFTPILFATDAGEVRLTVLLDGGGYLDVASWASLADTAMPPDQTAARVAAQAIDPSTGNVDVVADPYFRLVTGIVPAERTHVTLHGNLGQVVVPTYAVPGYPIRIFLAPAAGVSSSSQEDTYSVPVDVDGSNLLAIDPPVG